MIEVRWGDARTKCSFAFLIVPSSILLFFLLSILEKCVKFLKSLKNFATVVIFEGREGSFDVVLIVLV